MKGGPKSRDECFNAFAHANALNHGRIGLAVSRRVSLKAVVRNRIKRQVRESFRQHQALLAGLDVVVVAQARAAAVPRALIGLSLRTHWENIAHRCKKS